MSIAWLEFFAIVVAVVLWGHLLEGKKIIIRSDSKPVVNIINKQSSKKCLKMMKLVRFFVLQCLKSNVTFCAKHMEGKTNNIADALSRFQMARFRLLAQGAEPHCSVIPQFLWIL